MSRQNVDVIKSRPLTNKPASLLLVLILNGCATDTPPQVTPAPLPPTRMHLDVSAQAVINPDATGKASPVLLRVYELRESNNFLAADFFALFDKEQATLGAELIRKQDVWLKPGENKNIQFEPNGDTRILGIFAAFRKLDDAQWRTTSSVISHQSNSLTVKVDGNRLNIIAP